MTARRHLRLRRRGITLVEMLVASAIIALVIGAIGSLYVATLKLWTKGSAEDLAKQKAAWVLTRATDDFRETLQVSDFSDTWVKARLPEVDWDGDLDTRMNVVQVDQSGELYLVKGGYVSYFLGDANGNPDDSGTYVWRQTLDSDGNVIETRQLTDGVLPNPDDPATGDPKPFIKYWPVFETGRAIEMTLTVTAKVGPNTSTVTVSDWFMLRNR